MPNLEGVTHSPESVEGTSNKKQRSVPGERGSVTTLYAKKVTDAPTEQHRDITSPIATSLRQLRGHHQLLGGTEAIRIEEMEQYLIAETEIPEGYFANQQRIAREQGHGTIQITPELKAEAARIIRGDQEGSLRNWVDYLNDPTAPYPQEFKYFVLRNVLTMGVYDKEHERYGKRSRGTTAPYPELSREAFSLVYDQYTTGKPIPEREENEEEPQMLNPDERFLRILKPTDFGKDYARALELTRPKDQDLSSIEGEWITFRQTEDPEKIRELADFLQGKGTDWCTAGGETAKTHLAGGDFHIFASYDEEGKPTNPRVAIRMQQGEVAEVRGINAHQELEAELIDTAEEQLKTLPGGESYQQKATDMKLLTAIEKKHMEAKTLTKEELRFLYEFDRKIESFGYGRDPRITELHRARDIKVDGAVIFDCTPEQIARDYTELSDETIALLGNLYGSALDVLPNNLEYVHGVADLRHSSIQSLGKVTTIRGNLLLSDSQVETLGELTIVGASAVFRNSQVHSLGKLQTVGDSLALSASHVTDTGELSFIGGNLIVDDSLYERVDVGKLNRIAQRGMIYE